jgi:hypothetical protein
MVANVGAINPGLVYRQLPVKGSKPGVRTFPKSGVIYQPTATPHSIAKKIVHITQSALEGADDFVRTASEVTMTVGNIFRESLVVSDFCKNLKPVFERLKAASILLAPVYLFDLGNGIYEFAKHRTDLENFLINTFGSLGRFTCSIVLLLRDLAAINVIPSGVVSFLWPFDLIGIALNAISIRSHTKGWAETAQFAKQFEALIAPYKGMDLSLEEVEAVMKFVNEAKGKKLGQALDHDSEMIATRIDRIGRDAIKYGALVGDPKSAEVHKEWKEAMKSLKGRVTSKIVSHKLSITASSVDLVANSILFSSLFFAPACPILFPLVAVGFALKGIAGVISISNTLFKIVTARQFSKGLGLDKAEPEGSK